MGNIQSETWFIVLSVVAGFIGIGGWAGNRLGYKHKFIIYARLIGLLAVVFIVVAYGIAIFRGRGLGLTQALFSNPASFFRGVASGKDYSDACFDDKGKVCANHCCTDFNDDDIKWKDCDEWCGSKAGHVGMKTEGDCKYDTTRDAYCNVSNLGKGDNFYEEGCNTDEHYGPITCTCCMSDKAEYWWDCSKECKNKKFTKGYSMPTANCKVTKEYHCLVTEGYDDVRHGGGVNTQSK